MDSWRIFAATCGDIETAILPCDAGIASVLMLVLNIMTGGVAILAVVGIVMVGLQWMSARDDVARATKAKRRMVEIVIGAVAYALVYAGLSFLLPGGSLDPADTETGTTISGGGVPSGRADGAGSSGAGSGTGGTVVADGETYIIDPETGEYVPMDVYDYGENVGEGVEMSGTFKCATSKNYKNSADANTCEQYRVSIENYDITGLGLQNPIKVTTGTDSAGWLGGHHGYIHKYSSTKEYRYWADETVIVHICDEVTPPIRDGEYCFDNRVAGNGMTAIDEYGQMANEVLYENSEFYQKAMGANGITGKTSLAPYRLGAIAFSLLYDNGGGGSVVINNIETFGGECSRVYATVKNANGEVANMWFTHLSAYRGGLAASGGSVGANTVIGYTGYSTCADGTHPHVHAQVNNKNVNADSTGLWAKLPGKLASPVPFGNVDSVTTVANSYLSAHFNALCYGSSNAQCLAQLKSLYAELSGGTGYAPWATVCAMRTGFPTGLTADYSQKLTSFMRNYLDCYSRYSMELSELKTKSASSSGGMCAALRGLINGQSANLTVLGSARASALDKIAKDVGCDMGTGSGNSSDIQQQPTVKDYPYRSEICAANYNLSGEQLTAYNGLKSSNGLNCTKAIMTEAEIMLKKTFICNMLNKLVNPYVSYNINNLYGNGNGGLKCGAQLPTSNDAQSGGNSSSSGNGSSSGGSSNGGSGTTRQNSGTQDCSKIVANKARERCEAAQGGGTK